jgi:uncharacterized protein (DUF433 family)
MATARNDGAYTPSQVAVVTGLPLSAVQKAIEHNLVRPKRVREGGIVRRVLSKAQLVYLRLEARGLKSLPLLARRRVAQAVERDPGIDAVMVTEGGVILVECKSARKEVNENLRQLAQAQQMARADPGVMRGTPVFKGTRIPVEAVADMLAHGAAVDEILEGYPALTAEKIALAPVYVKAFPRRGRPAVRPWARREPRRTSRRHLPAG